MYVLPHEGLNLPEVSGTEGNQISFYLITLRFSPQAVKSCFFYKMMKYAFLVFNHSSISSSGAHGGSVGSQSSYYSGLQVGSIASRFLISSWHL